VAAPVVASEPLPPITDRLYADAFRRREERDQVARLVAEHQNLIETFTFRPNINKKENYNDNDDGYIIEKPIEDRSLPYHDRALVEQKRRQETKKLKGCSHCVFYCFQLLHLKKI
jgi:hypothetical protein